MKTLLVLGLVLAFVAPAFSGDCASCLDGFGCDNICPLAHQANTHRSLGTEAPRVSVVVRDDLARRLAADLARI